MAILPFPETYLGLWFSEFLLTWANYIYIHTHTGKLYIYTYIHTYTHIYVWTFGIVKRKIFICTCNEKLSKQ